MDFIASIFGGTFRNSFSIYLDRRILMISVLTRKIKIFIFLLSRKVYDDTKFFNDKAICKGCNELEDVYRYEEGGRVWLFHFIPVRLHWRLEMCTYCYTVRKQEFTWGRDKVELDWSFSLIKKRFKKKKK